MSDTSDIATPPPGFTMAPNNGVIIPVNTGRYRAPRLDERLGVITDPNSDILPQPGQLLIPGPVDSSANPTFISASPLTGIRQLSISDPASAAALLNINNGLTSNGRPARTVACRSRRG